MALTRPKYSNIVDGDYKASCRVATTTDVTLAGGAPDTYDGVSLAAGDRVLVTGQNTGSQNGIYIVQILGTGSDGTWVRSFDADRTGRLTAGAQLGVGEGTYGGTIWRLTTPDPITIGSTVLTWVSAGSGTPGGVDGQVQVNSGGVLAGASGLVYAAASGNLVIPAGTVSANVSTGSLVVEGGVGISENMYIGDDVNVGGNVSIVGSIVSAATSTGNALVTGGSITGITAAASTLVATNFSTGNAQITGGVVNASTIAADNFSSGNIYQSAADTFVASNFSSGNIYQSAADTFVASNFSSPNAVVSGGSIDNTAIGSSTRSSGYFEEVQAHADSVFYANLTVNGNLALNGNTVIINQSDLNIVDAIINLHSPNDLTPLTVNDGKDIGVKFHYFDTADNHAFVGRANDTGFLEWYAAGEETAGNVFVGDYGTVKTGELVLANSTPSTSSSTGALRVTGGVGVLGDIYATGNIILGSSTTSNVVVNATTTSTTSTTGALVVKGGIGVTGNIYLNGAGLTGNVLDLNNGSVAGINSLYFNDPGVNEGMTWAGGNGWWVYESPDGLTNGAGNLQIVRSGTRVVTVDTNNALRPAGLTLLAAGTSSVPPLQFQSGTSTTTAVSGAMEYDGKVFFGTTEGAERGLLPAPQIYILNANRGLATVTTTQTLFNQTFKVTSNTRYYYEAVIHISKTNATANTLQYAIVVSGAVLAAHKYMVESKWGAAITTVAALNEMSNRITTGFNTLVSVSAASAAAAATVNARIQGVIDVTTGGTINPHIALATNAPTAPTLIAGSSWIMYPVGPISANTVIQ